MSEVDTELNNDNSGKKKMAVSRKRETGGEIVAVNPSASTRKRRRTSAVWEHFTRIQDGEGTWAMCVHCKKRFTGGSRSGTTHLRKHAISCLAYRQGTRNVGDASQPSFSGLLRKHKDMVVTAANQKKDVITMVENTNFNQESSLNDLARMIILHEYPFSIVEHAGFRAYVHRLQPRFNFVSSSDLRDGCMAVFESEKQKLYEVMNKLQRKVNFSLDLGSSGDDGRYLCLSCHYVDEDWKLRKKLLKYCEFSTPQRSVDIAEAISTTLSEWSLDRKLCSLVVDDYLSMEVIVAEFAKILSTKEIEPVDIIFLSCYACTLISMVQDGFDSISEVISKIRESFKYVNSSEERQKVFHGMLESVQFTLVLDEPTRWQSTFTMLELALNCRDFFIRMAEVDADFTCPSLIEWDMLKHVLECLKTFYDATEVLYRPKPPTANLYFGIICELYLALKDWCASSHPSIAFMASKMMEKFKSYWSVTHKLLAVSAILDPQQKMKPVELYFPMIFGDDEAKQKIKDVNVVLTEQFHKYSINPAHTVDGQTLLCYAENGSAGGETVGVDESSHAQLASRLKRLDKFLQESSSSQSSKTELDMYLEEVNYPVKDGLGVDFDILAWWKLNAPKYPILAQMACNILAIPISTVVSKGSSNSGGRVVDQYRNSYHLKTSNDLLYAQDWLHSDLEGKPIDGTLDTLPSMLSMEVDENQVYGGVETILSCE